MPIKTLSLGILLGIATLACTATYARPTRPHVASTATADDYPIPVCPPDVPVCPTVR